MSTVSHNEITVTGLSIGYRHKKKEVVIASDLDFKVLKGQLTAIVGRNGIGKSTLLRTLARIQPALSGIIQIKGTPLTAYRNLAWAKITSLVLTEPIASKNLTVFELIALGRQPYTNWIGTLTASDTHKINEVIDRLTLNTIAHRKCFELSDGQLQRVLIARALAQDTQIILLDEPTSHLDLHHKVSILKLLKKIAQETQKTILFTSHEIELAIQLCDKMLLMGSDGFPFGTPRHLTDTGAFDKLFPHESVTFNSETQTFQVRD